MKMLKVFLLSIFLLSLSPINHIYALEEGFYSTTSFTIGEVPSYEEVLYTSTHIEGEYTSDVLPHKYLAHLTMDNYRSRIFDRLTMLALPPFSQVDVGYYWYNYTPGEVDIETIRIPLSREQISRGDMTQIFYENPNQEFEWGITHSDGPSKGGNYVDVEGVGLVQSDMDTGAGSGVVIESFTIKPAVELYKWEITMVSGTLVGLKLYVRNNTDTELENIWINYKDSVSKEIDLGPYAKYYVIVYKNCVLSEDNINCGAMKIMDRNTKAHCIANGADWDNYLRPDSISVWNKIEEEWTVGAQFHPDRESLCIRRLPYAYWTEELIADYNPPEPPPTQEEYWKDILGLELLPITNYQSGIESFFRLIKPLFTDNLSII